MKQALPKGTRLGSLAQSRLRTVADLAYSSPSEIAAVPGIGPQSAQAIHDEAVAHRTRVRAGERLRLNPQQKGTRETQLLTILTAVDRVGLGAATLGGHRAVPRRGAVRKLHGDAPGCVSH
ncbi:helix-hairpin-helix domain-containing protein [Rhodococcus sp. KRD197]|uniref:helix-hairpin-helix domain-containing protein n=1 Tax=unclassified Rhodococcus (in: high G+C Gram-positive bacteria) TaxID=192944 RepID=UPI0034D418F7